MIGGLLVGAFSIASLAFLTWMLIRSHKHQGLSDGSRGFRTFIIGTCYTVQLVFMGYLSSRGQAYRWFRGPSAPDRADTLYVVGLVIGIFAGAILLYLLVNRGKNRA